MFDPKQNHLLAASPVEEWQRSQHQLQHIELPLSQVLYKSGGTLSPVYFPTTPLVSLLNGVVGTAAHTQRAARRARCGGAWPDPAQCRVTAGESVDHVAHPYPSTVVQAITGANNFVQSHLADGRLGGVERLSRPVGQASWTGDHDAPVVQPQACGLGQIVGMCCFECGDRQDLLKLCDLDFIEILKSHVSAGPSLMFVESLATLVESPQTCDAHRRRFQCIADRSQQRLGHGSESVYRSAAGSQEEQLDGCRYTAVVVEPLGDRSNIVLAQGPSGAPPHALRLSRPT